MKHQHCGIYRVTYLHRIKLQNKFTSVCREIIVVHVCVQSDSAICAQNGVACKYTVGVSVVCVSDYDTGACTGFCLDVWLYIHMYV